MNNISFYLARPHGTTPTVIYARLRLNGSQIKIFTGLSVLPKHWNNSRQRVKSTVVNAAPFNDRLDKITVDLCTIVLDIENQHIKPTADLVRQRFQALSVQLDSKPAEQKSVFECWEEWLKSTERTKSSQTIRNYRSVLNHFKSFSKDRGFNITFDRMDRHFVNALIEYLLKVQKMTNATLWNVFKTWKAFMKWANDLELTDNRFYDSVTKKDFRVPEHRMFRLNEMELQQIAELPLQTDGFLENARNLFVLQCCLGVRYSDLERIVQAPNDHIDGDFIRLTTQKNHKSVVIPLLPAARRILVDKVAGIRPISHQRFNDYLKQVAEKAGLTDTIIKIEFRGSQQTRRTVRKCDEIASHTAKRTFVSLMIARGISAETIMKITGNSRATIDRYIILNEEDIKREMEKAADLLNLPKDSMKSGTYDGREVVRESLLPYFTASQN